jgi:hypothetical protein
MLTGDGENSAAVAPSRRSAGAGCEPAHVTAAARGLAVAHGDRRDRILVKRLLTHLERTRSQHWVSLDFPEDRISSREAVQAVAMEETGRTTAIEHVPVEGFDVTERGWQPFAETFVPLARDPAMRVPGCHIDVRLSVPADRTASNVAVLAAGVRTWCARHLAAAPDGTSAHVIIVTGTPLQLHVDKTPCPGEPGRVHIVRAESPRHFETIIQAQLQAKLGKLMSASADRHVLLFENSRARWSISQLRFELTAGIECPGLSRIDEAWMVDTTRWSEDSLAFRLVTERED